MPVRRWRSSPSAACAAASPAGAPPARADSTPRRRRERAPTPEAATRMPSAPPTAEYREHRVVVGVRAVETGIAERSPPGRRSRARACRRRTRGTPRRPRLLAPGADRCDARAQREQRRLQIAARRAMPAGAQRLPPIVPTARISRSATCRAAVASGSGAPRGRRPAWPHRCGRRRSALSTPLRPARPSMSTRAGRSWPYVNSGSRIVPPPIPSRRRRRRTRQRPRRARWASAVPVVRASSLQE